MAAKQYGEAWVYGPIQCLTGGSQPYTERDGGGSTVRAETIFDFAPGSNYEAFFDARCALDAPERIPSGGIRAQEFEPASSGRLLIAHVYRAGTWQ